MSHSVKIYADYGENSLDKSLYFQYAFLSIGRLVIDSLSLSRLKRSHIINWLWMVSIVAVLFDLMIINLINVNMRLINQNQDWKYNFKCDMLNYNTF